MILAFPEQLQTVNYFDMQPGHGSGYGQRMDVKPIQGILQCTEGRRVKNQNGNWVVTRGVHFWYEGVLVMGRFIDDGQMVYRIVKDDDWTTESGFAVYSLERVTGADGTELTEPAFNDGTQGAGSFS
jgi:hypothetical protein